jgi:hypothetical protein
MKEAEFKKLAEECMSDDPTDDICQSIDHIGKEALAIIAARDAEIVRLRRELEEAKALIVRMQFGVKKDQ